MNRLGFTHGRSQGDFVQNFDSYSPCPTFITQAPALIRSDDRPINPEGRRDGESGFITTYGSERD
jgi:hypothetical protein